MGVKPDQEYCFQPVLAQGVQLPCYDFPSLKHLEIEKFNIVGNTYAGMEFATYEIVLKNKHIENYQDLIKKTVYIGYPFQREARIISIMTKQQIFTQTPNGVVTHQNKFYGGVQKKAKYLAQEKKIDFNGDTQFVCTCKILGHLIKNFKKVEYSKKFYQ